MVLTLRLSASFDSTHMLGKESKDKKYESLCRDFPLNFQQALLWNLCEVWVITVIYKSMRSRDPASF
jgi:hypothetical protein